jgi:hypothetical protein
MRVLLLILILISSETISIAAPADLSMLSDFGQPDIPSQALGILPSSGNEAGILQMGNLNKAAIDQTGGTNNNAEVWQNGTSLSADVSQHGRHNELRLSQSGDHNTAVLDQVGSSNQMAIWQFGSNALSSGAQVGDGNQLVLQQQGNSQFQFSQTGNLNQIVVDLPTGMSLRVDQLGDGKYFSFHPGN